MLGEAAMTRLKSLGKIVYLQLPLAQIETSGSNIKTRGMPWDLEKDWQMFMYIGSFV